MRGQQLDHLTRALHNRVGKLEVPQAVEDAFGLYRDEPVRFCREVLGVASATRRSTGAPYQFAVLEDLVASPRVAVRSGHGVGKSGIDAWAALWWLLTRPLSRVVVLTPEFSRQIRGILFPEMRKWARRAKVALPLKVLTARALIDGFGEEWSATGMSAAGDVDRIEGFHAEGGVLLIVDEAKGISQEAFDAVQGALSGLEDSRILVTSVPGGAGAGPFWRACGPAADRWAVHHVPSTDSSLVDPQWVEDRAHDWGRGSPMFLTRVMGEFADAGDGVLFPLPLLDAAMGRAMVSPTATLGLGVDVARSVAGDLNVVALERNGVLGIRSSWRSPDTMETTRLVVQAVTETGAREIAVDVGGPGGGVVDRLQQLGYRVSGVAFGGAAQDPQRFRNRRAELFWRLREALEQGTAALPDDDEVRADLSSLRYTFTQDGKILIEPKDECRKRLGRSPDRADALALAWAALHGAEAGAVLNISIPIIRADDQPELSTGPEYRPFTPMNR